MLGVTNAILAPGAKEPSHVCGCDYLKSRNL